MSISRSTLFERMSDAQSAKPPAVFEPPPPHSPPTPRPPHPGITEDLAKRKNRSWEAFKVWIIQRSAEDIDAADPVHLARLYAPIEAREIAEILQIRKRAFAKARPK